MAAVFIMEVKIIEIPRGIWIVTLIALKFPEAIIEKQRKKLLEWS